MARGSVTSNFPVQITGIQSTGQRIIVTDSQESVHFVRYRKAENQLVVFCDDTTPRYVTTCCVLDYNTVAVGDKFGSISIVSIIDFLLPEKGVQTGRDSNPHLELILGTEVFDHYTIEPTTLL
ncbi:unnamed protein product [Nippostrongylus brasiliensis]|uniref:Splicing factor 3B subunit 3 (inferred by orthology to a human protein) n=1 Tax=Nippostrongylus brasiliensis TaxID=27835 RepID=A0A158R150_NIPBR|nr:unnamed protein product [Nippostrongylus brasiliensis]